MDDKILATLEKELEDIRASLSELPGSDKPGYALIEHTHPHTHPYAKENHTHPQYAKEHDHPYAKEHDHPYAKEEHGHSDLAQKEHNHSEFNSFAEKKHTHSDLSEKSHKHTELEKLIAKQMTMIATLEGKMTVLEKSVEALLGKPAPEPTAPPSGWEFSVKNPKGAIIQSISAERKK